MDTKNPAILLRVASKAARNRLHAEAKARKWSLQTYISHLIATHPERGTVTGKRVQDTDND